MTEEQNIVCVCRLFDQGGGRLEVVDASTTLVAADAPAPYPGPLFGPEAASS